MTNSETAVTQTVDESERRRLRRFPALELVAEMKSGKALVARWQPVQAFDFTRTGLSIAGPSIAGDSLKAGETLLLRLRLPLATGDLAADRLVAKVRNVQPQADGSSRYGVEFDFTANRHMKRLETTACLGRMEGILDRSEKLRNRLLNQRDVLQDLPT